LNVSSATGKKGRNLLLKPAFLWSSLPQTSTHSRMKAQVLKHEERIKILRKEITQLKEGPKEKAIDNNPMFEAKIEEISKKLGALEESLRNIIYKQIDHLCIHKAFLDFIEIQVKQFCNLSNIPPGLWKGGKEKRLATSTIDMEDSSQLTSH
ncbi:hypothetical protein KI387_020261, partial [Taxus chinensis]